MSTPRALACEIDAGIATISLNDGKANVMGLSMLGAIDAALERAAAESAAVVLTASGRSFSGGFDLSAFQRNPAELAQMLEAGARLAARLRGHSRPVVVACNGHAIAMGAFLLLSADLRLCADTPLRIQLNEVQIGLTMPRFAIELCRGRLAPSQLHAAIATARVYDAKQAAAAGFVDELVDPATLLAAAHARAKALAAMPAEAFAATKQRLVRASQAALEAAIADDVADWKSRHGPQAGSAL